MGSSLSWHWREAAKVNVNNNSQNLHAHEATTVDVHNNNQHLHAQEATTVDVNVNQANFESITSNQSWRQWAAIQKAIKMTFPDMFDIEL